MRRQNDDSLRKRAALWGFCQTATPIATWYVASASLAALVTCGSEVPAVTWAWVGRGLLRSAMRETLIKDCSRLRNWKDPCGAYYVGPECRLSSLEELAARVVAV